MGPRRTFLRLLSSSILRVLSEEEEGELESSVTGNGGLKMGTQVGLRAQALPLFLVPFHCYEA